MKDKSMPGFQFFFIFMTLLFVSEFSLHASSKKNNDLIIVNEWEENPCSEVNMSACQLTLSLAALRDLKPQNAEDATTEINFALSLFFEVLLIKNTFLNDLQKLENFLLFIKNQKIKKLIFFDTVGDANRIQTWNKDNFKTSHSLRMRLMYAGVIHTAKELYPDKIEIIDISQKTHDLVLLNEDDVIASKTNIKNFNRNLNTKTLNQVRALTREFLIKQKIIEIIQEQDSGHQYFLLFNKNDPLIITDFADDQTQKPYVKFKYKFNLHWEQSLEYCLHCKNKENEQILIKIIRESIEKAKERQTKGVSKKRGVREPNNLVFYPRLPFSHHMQDALLLLKETLYQNPAGAQQMQDLFQTLITANWANRIGLNLRLLKPIYESEKAIYAALYQEATNLKEEEKLVIFTRREVYNNNIWAKIKDYWKNQNNWQDFRILNYGAEHEIKRQFGDKIQINFLSQESGSKIQKNWLKIREMHQAVDTIKNYIADNPGHRYIVIDNINKPYRLYNSEETITVQYPVTTGLSAVEKNVIENENFSFTIYDSWKKDEIDYQTMTAGAKF